MTTIPPGAFKECADYETKFMKRPDGADATAFRARADSLAAMRSAIVAAAESPLLTEIDAKLDALLARPF